MEQGSFFDRRCPYCPGDPTEPGHELRCDGRQGKLEASIGDAEDKAKAARLPNFGPDFDGETYDRERDHGRLNAQLSRVLTVMKDGRWHTLADLSATTGGDPEASVSARIRDLRKEKFGGYEVERRYVDRGLFEYRLVITQAVS